jgi:hypothetical protein
MKNKTIITEIIYRFRLEFQDTLPEAHRADYRRRGIDPDKLWHLSESFCDLDEALASLKNEIQSRDFNFRKWRLTDNVVDECVEHKIRGGM